MAMADDELDEGRLLLELTRDVTSTLDLQLVLDKSLAALRRLIDFNGGSIQLIEDGYLRMEAGDPPPTPEAFTFRLPIGHGFGGRVAETGETIYSPDATVDPRAHPEGRKRASVAGTRSWFGAPLIIHGETIGIVQLDDLRVDHFPAAVQARIMMFLPAVSAAVQNALLYTQERHAVERLHEAEQLKRDFVATVSHELKTPLTVVRGFASLLAADAGAMDPDEVASIGQRIEAASDRLEAMVNDVLQISGIEHGVLPVGVEPTDVDRAVRAAIAHADHGSHQFEVAIPSDLPRVLTEAVRFEQVLVKLLDNAQKFSPAGSIVRVRAGADGDTVRLDVEDDGCGIPEDMHDKVFDAFVQVDSSPTRAVGGMGTGLFLARRLCDAIGATIAVASDVGHGSRFTVELEAAPR
jgi:signal transduction histidine kinase